MAIDTPDGFKTLWGNSRQLHAIAFGAYVLWSRLDNLNHSEAFLAWHSVTKVVLQCVFLMALFRAIYLSRHAYSQKRIICCVVIIAFFALCDRGTQAHHFLWLGLLVIAGPNVSIISLAKASLFSNGAALGVAVLGTASGLLNQTMLYRGTGGELVRMSLGFSHPNQLGACIVMFYLSLLVLRLNKSKFPSFVALVLFELLLFITSESRTAMLILVAAFIDSIFLSRARWKGKRVPSGFFIGEILACVILSVTAIILFNPDVPLWASLNKLLSNRLLFSHQCFMSYGVDVLGNQALLAGGSEAWFLVDNTYGTLLIRYGLIPFVVFLGVWVGLLAVLRFVDISEIDVLAVLLVLSVMAVVGLTEATAYIASYNLALPCAALLLFGKDRKNDLLGYAPKHLTSGRKG